jgi:hypothetical protein
VLRPTILSRTLWGAALGLAALLALRPTPARAQADDRLTSAVSPVRGEFGGGLVLAVPVGEFGEYVDLGGGISAFAVLYVDDQETIGLRVSGSWLIYGSNTVRVPLSPTVPFVDVDVTTQNWIGSLGFGPQIVLGHGAVRPHLHGSVGFSYFATTTSVEGSHSSGPFASTTNFDDFTFALEGGGGLRIALVERRSNPLSLDLGTSFLRHGLTDYLREDGLVEAPGGGVEVRPIRSRTSLAKFYVGVSYGMR